MARHRFLICLPCFGLPIYEDIARLCIRLLRTRGRFDGDILVFTDGAFTASAPDVRVVNVGDLKVLPVVCATLETLRARVASVTRFGQTAPLDRDGAVPGPVRVLYSKAFKCLTASYVDPSKYRQVAIMDTDMVAIDDVNPLFCAASGTAMGVDERPFNRMTAPSCGGDLLRPEERGRAERRWGINTGFICVASDAFHDVLRRWGEAFVAQAHLANEWADQPFFNLLALRRSIRFRPIPRAWIEAPPEYGRRGHEFRLGRSTKLLHLCMANKSRCFSKMEALSSLLDGGSRRKEIALTIRAWLSAARAAASRPPPGCVFR